MQKTITVEREIRYEGKKCDDETICDGHWHRKSVCSNFNKTLRPTDIRIPMSDRRHFRCRACLEKTGDV